MYWENQPKLPSDKGSNWSRGATRDIGSPPFNAAFHWIRRLKWSCMIKFMLNIVYLSLAVL